MKSTSTATASADPTRLGWDQSSSKSILLQASGQVVIDLDWKRRLTRSFEAGIGFRFHYKSEMAMEMVEICDIFTVGAQLTTAEFMLRP